MARFKSDLFLLILKLLCIYLILYFVYCTNDDLKAKTFNVQCKVIVLINYNNNNNKWRNVNEKI